MIASNVAARLAWAMLPLTALSCVSARGMEPGAMPGMDMSQATKVSTAGVTRTQVAGNYRIELAVLPPEPFYTAAAVSAQHVTEGMVVVGGAAPLSPTASPAPNHHLVVHVLDANSGKAVSDASVSLQFRPVDSSNTPTGNAVAVPVVIMQAAGAGAASTHYGNNVVMAPGDYLVAVNVNGSAATFSIRL